MYILIANISEFKEIKGAFLPPLQITHPSVLPAVHPSAKFERLVLASVGLLLDPERRYNAPWSKRHRRSLAPAVPPPSSRESAVLSLPTFRTLNLKSQLYILISKIMHPHPHPQVHLIF